MSVRLVQKVVVELKLKIDAFCYWVDAVSVLHLIRNQDKRFKLFVANRLSLIHHFTKASEWRYCPTDLNVADVGSRPLFPTDIDRLKLWLQGPEFLSHTPYEWPTSNWYDSLPPDVVLASFLRKPEDSAVVSSLNDLISRYSTFDRLLRTAAYLSRFKLFLLNKRSAAEGLLTNSDLDAAQVDLCRSVQVSSIPFLFDHLVGKPVSREHSNELNSFKKLAPFIDDSGVIRVGGRLQKSSLGFNVKHPILMPKRHHFFKLIVFHYHEMSRHSGYNYVLAQIR